MHKSRISNVNINFLWGIFLCLGIIMVIISHAEAGKITLVNPTSGTVGTVITVEGEDYTPSETIRIDLHGQFGAVRSCCSGEGTFSTSFTLGKHPGGINKFVVVGFTSYALDKGTVAVESRISLITPTSGKVGEFVTIDGDGYGSGEKICVSFGENPEIKTITADGRGGFRIVFTTDDQPAGPKKIIVTGTDSKESNATQYILQGGIHSVIPTYGHVGTQVTVTGAGFGKEEPIRVDFGKREGIVRTTSKPDGRFSFVFTVDTQSQGRKDIIVNGLSTGEKGENGFIITPHIELVTPTVGIVGSTITIVATGFGSLEPIRIDLGRTLAAGRTESNEDGVVTAQIQVSPQPGGVTRRLAVVGIRTRQISFTDIFTALPTIKISSTTGEVGTNICVHGEGFPSQEPVRIDFAKITTIAIATADERRGDFDAWFQVPAHPAGKADVTVTGVSSNTVLTAEFIVEPRIKLISPSDAGGLGDLIEIQGDGFGASELIQIDLGKTERIGEGVTDLDGNFIITFKVDAQAGGKNTCTAIGVSSGNQKTAPFTIKGNVLISPTLGVFGTVVNVTGSGYRASELIRVDFGKSTEIAKVTADANGSFNADFTVNTKTPGEVRVRIIGLQSWTLNTLNFTVVEEEKKEEKKEIKPEEGSEEGEQKEEESQEEEEEKKE
ncbi:MAG: hypothetical protein AB1567_12690 [bacterium]